MSLLCLKSSKGFYCSGEVGEYGDRESNPRPRLPGAFPCKIRDPSPLSWPVCHSLASAFTSPQLLPSEQTPLFPPCGSHTRSSLPEMLFPGLRITGAFLSFRPFPPPHLRPNPKPQHVQERGLERCMFNELPKYLTSRQV